MNKAIYYVLAILVLVGLIYTLSRFLTSTPHVPSAFPKVNATYATSVIQLTDPPQFPNGTQSLILNYSNIELHEAGAANNTGFVSLNYSGSVNLMNMTNLSQTIGIAKFKKNQSFDMIKLNVSGAKITISNKTYNVTVPGNKIMVRFNKNLNSSYNLSMIDLVSSVIQIYAQNQTIFVLVPSARAVVVKNYSYADVQVAHVGRRQAMPSSARQELARSRQNISITGAAISVGGNNTADISVTVKNTGNSSVVLKNVFVKGYMQLLANPSAGVRIPANGAPFQQGAGARNSSSKGINNVKFDANSLPNINITSSFNNISGQVLGNLSKVLNASGIKMGPGIEDSVRSLISSHVINNINQSNIEKVSSIVQYLQKNKDWNISNMTSKMQQYLSNANNSEKGRVMDILSNNTNLSIIGDMRDFNMSRMRSAISNASMFSRQYHNVLNFIILSNGSLSLPFSRQSGFASSPGPQAETAQASANAALNATLNVSLNSSAPRQNSSENASSSLVSANAIENATASANAFAHENLSGSQRLAHIANASESRRPEFAMNESEYSNYSRWAATGYTLASGASYTFTFDSKISIGRSPLTIALLENQTYVINVIGEEGASATANVTAS
ncbi:MAG: hypothetical protein M1331_03605 [Candidatus Marsarchaeota archaeon]|nr:hypothetical protein [Candidatus Marsarchaeota archaeon]